MELPSETKAKTPAK